MAIPRWIIRSRLSIVVAAGLCSFVYLTSRHSTAGVSQEPDPRIASIVLQAAKDYKSFGLVDDTPRLAPALCGEPAAARLRMSDSGDSFSHGRKLYSLFAKYRGAYSALEGPLAIFGSLVGQTVVKESWEPVEMTPGEEVPDVVGPALIKAPVMDRHYSDRGLQGRFVRVVEVGGKRYRMGRKAALFVMTKVSPDTPGTDQGWIYATLDPNAQVVTAAGRIQSCMACHVRAPSDRLFGLKKP